ncbi:MAG: PilN domain-containing protein [Pseudomonadota bacterium]
MPRINLLPWREEQRKQRQQQFGIAAAAAIGVAALFVWIVNLFFDGRIDYQRDRNLRLENEIAQIRRSITEIEDLEQQKDRLLARMEIIEQLQTSRPEVVHLFQELVASVPDGVYLTGVTQTNRDLAITGLAQSSTRVSALMRNIDASPWLTDPQLDKIETVVESGNEEFRFELTAKQDNPNAEDGEEQ